MRILMTGANGFVGQAFLQRQQGNHEFVTLGRSAPAFPVSRHVEVDLAKSGDLTRVISSGALPTTVDAVIHFAVSRLHRSFPDTALDMFNVNVASTAELMDYVWKAKVPYVVLGSTGTVYSPFEKPVLSERDTTTPASYIGWSKLSAEQLAGQYAPKFTKLFIPRFFVPYGPGQSGRMIDGLIERVRDGVPVTIPAEGRGLVAAPIYVDDAVAVIERAIAQSWTGACNVASAEVLSILEMAQIIGRVVGREPVVTRDPAASSANLVPDLTKLQSLTDISNFVSFEDGIARVVASSQSSVS